MRSIGTVLALLVMIGQPSVAGSLSPGLEEALIQAGPDDRVPVVVMMEEHPAQAELLAAVRGLNREDRRHHVVSTLKQVSQRSQRPVRDLLSKESSVLRDALLSASCSRPAASFSPNVPTGFSETC